MRCVCVQARLFFSSCNPPPCGRGGAKDEAGRARRGRGGSEQGEEDRDGGAAEVSGHGDQSHLKVLWPGRGRKGGDIVWIMLGATAGITLEAGGSDMWIAPDDGEGAMNFRQLRQKYGTSFIEVRALYHVVDDPTGERRVSIVWWLHVQYDGVEDPWASGAERDSDEEDDSSDGGGSSPIDEVISEEPAM